MKQIDEAIFLFMQVFFFLSLQPKTFSLSQSPAEEYSGAVLGKNTRKDPDFLNGFFICECFDNYCNPPPPLSVWWWSLWTTSSFCFHKFPNLSFTWVWNGTHADLLRGPVAGNFKRKQWKPDPNYLFPGRANTFLLKMRNNCRENCSQFEKRDRGDLLLQGERTRCDPWFTQ